jgi:ATP-dependent DNA helicase RecG
MTEQEVIEEIHYMQEYQTETDRIEAKTAEKDYPKKCYDTISAFANKIGGIIIFGINENNNFIEQSVYDVNDLQKQITSLCTDSMEPKIRPEFYRLHIRVKDCWL